MMGRVAKRISNEPTPRSYAFAQAHHPFATKTGPEAGRNTNRNPPFAPGRRIASPAAPTQEFLHAWKQSQSRADSGAAPTPHLAVDERVLDVVVEEFTLRLRIEQPVVNFRGHFPIAIDLAARERDVQLAGVIVVFDERHHR